MFQYNTVACFINSLTTRSTTPNILFLQLILNQLWILTCVRTPIRPQHATVETSTYLHVVESIVTLQKSTSEDIPSFSLPKRNARDISTAYSICSCIHTTTNWSHNSLRWDRGVSCLTKQDPARSCNNKQRQLGRILVYSKNKGAFRICRQEFIKHALSNFKCQRHYTV